MSGPTLARSDEQGRRFYTFGDPVESYWSVTTIISGGIPKFLHAHYAKMTAELALESLVERGPHSRPGAIIRRLAARGRQHVQERQARGELTSIKLAKLSPRDLALRWLKEAADRHRDAAAERGSAVHDEAERMVLQHAREASRLYLEHADVRPWPSELAGYQLAFTRWVEAFHPEFLAAEATVFNRAQAFGGTLDAICRVTLPDGGSLVLIIDYKSGKAIYAEVALQLAAYARAEFIGAPDGQTQLAMPAVDAGAVLHLRGDGTFQFRLVRIDDPVFAAFCFAREVYRWLNDTSKTVLLQDLTPEPVEAVA